MAGDYTRRSRFAKSLIDWLASDETLVSLTSHSSEDAHIYVRASNEAAVLPGLLCEIQHSGAMLNDSDAGPFVSTILVESFAKDPEAASNIMGAVEQLCMEDEDTRADAAFPDDDGISTVSLMFTPLPEDGVPTSDEDSGVYMSAGQISVIWKDTYTPA